MMVIESNNSLKMLLAEDREESREFSQVVEPIHKAVIITADSSPHRGTTFKIYLIKTASRRQ